MKRTFWILTCLAIVLAGAWLGWQWSHSTNGGAGRPSSPVVSPRLSSTASGGKTVSGKSPHAGFLQGTNQLAWRLSNTPKKLGQLLTNPHAILLQNALIDTTASIGALNIPPLLQAQGDPGAYIIQARGVITPAFRAALQQVSGRIVSYIPNNAYLVQATASAAGELAGSPLVQSVIPYQPYFKLQPTLLALAAQNDPIPPATMLTVGLFSANSVSILEQSGFQPVGAAEPSPFGGQIVKVLASSRSTLAELASLPVVQAVELGHTRVGANDLARVTMGISTDTVTNANWLGLDGQGVTVEMNDSGVDATHPDFSATGNAQAGSSGPTRVTGDFAISLTDTNGHGTHVAGIIAGNGSESHTVNPPPQGSVTNADFRGKAPLASLYVVGGVDEANGNGIPDFYLQQQPALTNALISNNSWAYAGDNNYDLAAASYDAATRDAMPLVPGPQPVLYVFAAGNDGGGSSDGTGGNADTILSPGTAKNVITVGALEQLRDLTNVITDVTFGQTNSGPFWQGQSDSSNQVAYYSARGNVGVNTEGPFGRFKPDVVAPGSWVVSCRSSEWDTNAYYNPTNQTPTVYTDQTVTTNVLQYYNVTVPPNAVSVTIQITSNQFTTVFPPGLVIYAQQSGYPDPVGAPTSIDETTYNNTLAIPPGGGNLTIPNIAGNGFDFAVGDTTNAAVNYNLTVTIDTTNSTGGNEEQVLEQLNQTLAPWYRYESGTSMAAPAVSGMLALVQQYLQSDLGVVPSPALLKAMLINGTRSLGSYFLSVTNDLNTEGWGLPNIQYALPVTTSNLTSIGSFSTTPMFFVDQSPTNALATGQSHTYVVTINTNAADSPQSYQLQATLVWTDPPGDPSAAVKLVNGLELIITNLDTGDVFIGNDINGNAGYNMPTPTNAAPNIDTVNNVENIIIPPVLGGHYSVTVLGRDVNVNAVTEQTNDVVQDFALVVSVGEGEAPDAISSVTDQGIASNLTADQDVTYVGTTNQALFNQFVGANTPFQGTNQVGLGSNTIWGANGALTLGMTNQWHFYVVTNNALDSNGQSFDVTNAGFITFNAYDLSIPRMGVYEEANPANATRPQADIDLYVTTDPGLTNLSPVTLSNCLAGVNNSGVSLTRGGTEAVVFTNSHPGEVYYVGVISEDQMASEYSFIPIFTSTPFSQLLPNGDELVNGLLLPAYIPDGSPAVPGTTNVFAIATSPMTIQNVVVTNLNQHQNFGDLIGALSFSGSTAILNNHDGLGNTYNTIVPLVYDDSPTPSPGSRNSDGPGGLLQFQGKSAVGAWILNETDDSQGATGQVSQLSLLIQPHLNLLFPGIVVAIPAGGWFSDYVSVPPGFTNLTFFATNLPPLVSPPLQMYEKFGSAPTASIYDFAEGLTNTVVPGGNPGNSISIGPPLDIGNYFISIYNPGSSPANVYIAASLGIDTSINDTFNFTSTGPTPLPSDVVTMSSPISVTATQLVESASVGLVVKSPQISDMTFTLVSPTGQRILLMENRGGLNTSGAGSVFTYTNVLNSTATGGAATSTNILATPGYAITVPISYNFYAIPDEMTVYEGTNPATFYINSPTFLHDTTLTNGAGNFLVTVQPPFTNLTIIMNQFGNPDVGSGGDAWVYTAGAPVTNFQYLTFTEDTNLASVPIKFAVPPFSFSPSNPPNYVLSDFSTSPPGLYTAPTNIPDAYGGWSVPTNLQTLGVVVNSTNVEVVTNNLFLTNNYVSVVSDPAHTPGDGSTSNILALAKGSITRVIPTVPGNIYNVTFWYRGPDIASWWRGEGNAGDSSDPENNGNNGSLVGLFNFPAGEVGQAFDFFNGGNEFQFAGTNAYVQVPQSASLDVGQSSGFTVEGWINPTNVARTQPLVEWLAHVPTNSLDTNIVIKAGPYLDRATGDYFYLLGSTDWVTSEQWAQDLGGHLATVNTANLQNWIFDNFAGSGIHNRNLWLGLTNIGPSYVWSSGGTNTGYFNWLSGQPDNTCSTAIYTGMLGATNNQAGLWMLVDDQGVACNAPNVTNAFYGVAEVPGLQPNGVQFWISATNTPGSTNAPFTTAHGALYADIVDTSNVDHEIYSAPGLLTNNVFQHVALTYDTNSGMAMLYLDGTNVASTNFGSAFVPKTSGDVLLGRDMSASTNDYYGGLMDEISVYRRSLSPAEILAIYQASALTTNRLAGKFNGSVAPPYNLAEAAVSFGSSSNVIFGVNNLWEMNSYTFTATTNVMPLTISGIEPGMLLDDFQVSQAPATNLYYLPEQSLTGLNGSPAAGNWTLQIWNNLTGALVTNVSELLSWNLSLVLQSNSTFAASLSPDSPLTTTVPGGQIVYYQVNVPSWAHFATNLIVSSTLPVDLLFNPTNTPTGAGPGDQPLLPLGTSGTSPAVAVNSPLPYSALQAGSSYILGVENPNSTPAQVVLQVNYDMVSLTNGVPFTTYLTNNAALQYFQYTVASNAAAATFQVLKSDGDVDLVLSRGAPLPNLTNATYGSFNGTNLDETIYVLTNSAPVPVSPGTWFMGVFKRQAGTVDFSVLARELDVTNAITNSVSLVALQNGVPANGVTGPGADLTNFYSFTESAATQPGATNYGVMFELYNMNGNADLLVQTNGLPLGPPFFQTSQNRGVNPETILVFTNASYTNIDMTYYLGVPSHELTNVQFTIVAEVMTNAYLPGFPGASGAGGGAVGAGHAGTDSSVYHVINLNDSGPGTLRDAINSTNRTVVFDLSGQIVLQSPLVITQSFLTVDGQTAPGGGITIVGDMTAVRGAHDVILRDLRMRNPGIDDGIQFLLASNILADHLSAEWTSNSLLSVLNSSNVTVQWSILSKTLSPGTNDAVRLRDGAGQLSLNHDLFADDDSGVPRLGDNLALDFVNNVVFNWGSLPGYSTNDAANNPGGFTNELNESCNYFIAGSNSILPGIAFAGGSFNTWIFQTNNFMDSNTNGILDGANTQWQMFSGLFTSVGHPFPIIPPPTDEAFLAYEKVLDFSGANDPARDSVDQLVVTNVRTQTDIMDAVAGISPVPASQPVYLDTDQDGIPDFWETTFGQKPYAPSNNDPSTNLLGYTTLEEYTAWLAKPHALTLTNTPVFVDLRQMYGGTGNLAFFATNAFNGSVYLTNVLGSVTNSGPYSNSIAVFVPTNSTPVFSGYAGFDVYVTNADTVAYFGPVPVSVVVSKEPVLLNSNIPPTITRLSSPFINPSASLNATNYYGSDYYVFDVTNNGAQPPVAVLFSVTNASGPVDLVANYGPELPSLSSFEFISTNWPTNETILISSNSTPVALTNGDWTLAVVNVAGSNVTYSISATELFSVSPPVFLSPTNGDLFSVVATFPFSTNALALDTNTPALPLTFALVSGPSNLFVSPSGIISWTPTLAQGPTTNGPSTNAVLVSVSNGDYFVTNAFTIVVQGTNIPPTLPAIPNQVVAVPGPGLLLVNTGTNPNLPDYPLAYTLIGAPPFASINSQGIITLAPAVADAGSNYLITTVVTDTNPWAVNATSLSVTNAFLVTVDAGLTQGVPQTNTAPAGGPIQWMVVNVPTNALDSTNSLVFATNLPVNLWFSANLPPSITNTSTDVELLTNVSAGSRVLLTNGFPAIIPGGSYLLGVQNTNAVNVQYALQVGFDLLTFLPNQTNAVPFAGIVHTNMGGTNGFLLTWFAPSNDLFTVQWTSSLSPAAWNSFTNVVSYNPAFPASATRAQFNFFDDGSQDGGLAGPHFYRLILLGTPNQANSLSLAPQANRVTGPGVTLTITNQAADSDPYAVLTFSLLSAPSGASINASNGVISWAIPTGAGPSTNLFVTQVTDNGVPPAVATNAFSVEVETIPPISSESLQTNGLLLTWFAPSNELFQVQWRTNLLGGGWSTFTNIVAYNPLFFTSPSHTQFNFLDDGTLSGPFSIPHYYRLLLLPAPVSPPPAGPAISRVLVSAGGTTLLWSAPTNETFKVQWTTNLMPPVLWYPFTNIISSTTGAFSFTDTNTPLVVKFYELLMLP